MTRTVSASSKRRSNARRAMPRCKKVLSLFLFVRLAADQKNILLLRHVKFAVIETGHRHRDPIVVLAGFFDVVRGVGQARFVHSRPTASRSRSTRSKPTEERRRGERNCARIVTSSKEAMCFKRPSARRFGRTMAVNWTPFGHPVPVNLGSAFGRIKTPRHKKTPPGGGVLWAGFRPYLMPKPSKRLLNLAT